MVLALNINNKLDSIVESCIEVPLKSARYGERISFDGLSIETDELSGFIYIEINISNEHHNIY